LIVAQLDHGFHVIQSCLLKFWRITQLAPDFSMAAMATPWMGCIMGCMGCSKAASPAIPRLAEGVIATV
jgi:hypothetical protein